MDYLVFGVGFGSTLVLVGWVLRQFGPAFRYRNEPDDVLSAEQILERNDWQRFCIAMGALLSVCGAVILLVTLITLLVRPSDRVGTIIVGSLFVLSLLAVAGWVVMYVNQHRALAGDRRAEVLASKGTRKAAKPRQTSKGVTPADAVSTATATSTTASPAAAKPQPGVTAAPAAPAESLEDLNRRRRAAQAQRQATDAPVTASTESASRPSSRPAQTVAAPTAEAPTSPVDPSQALRNVQFKRSGSNRHRDEQAQAATAESPTTTTTTVAPSRPARPFDEPSPVDDVSATGETHQESDHDDA
ncbi:MAG TPA: hypothetical protein VNP95_09140 [Thermomicrobiales bacterium]|nr:hypothetical protein [Thermomicrobiales bacterium]